MSGQAILPSLTPEPGFTPEAGLAPEGVETPEVRIQPRRHSSRAHVPFVFHAPVYEEQAAMHQAELFYLQKQIQSQTPMVIVMEDGETISGAIEWYDRFSLKVRGRSRMLVYKSAIKYMYKQGENG